MNHRIQIPLAIAGLALAALACQAVTGGPKLPSPTEVIIENTSLPVDTATAVPQPTETEAPLSSSDVLLEDDFSSSSRSKWGTGTDTDSAIEYVDDALNMQLFSKNYFIWSSPNDQNYENIHMEVTVINNNTDATTAFGFVCYQQHPITDSSYYFAVTPGGEYAIARAALAQKDVFLTNNNNWAKSDLIVKNADSYHLGAGCGNGTLTRYVDDQKVDSVSDSTYTSGGIALFTWSGENVASANVSFDDFVLKQLP